MKISYVDYADRKRDIGSIESAIADAATPDAYSYSGQLEKLEAENSKLREIVGRLVEVLYDDRARTKHEAVAYILGPGYEVEE